MSKELKLESISRQALLVGALGTLACLVGLFLDVRQFVQSYLFGYTFWLEIGLGFLGLYMLHPLVGGRWGQVLQPIFRSGVGLMWYWAVLFIPIALGAAKVYPWMDAREMLSSHEAHHRLVYLNLPFFIGRALLYFVVWIGLARALLAPRGEAGRRKLSAGGLMLFGFSSSFALIDWVMTLDRHWFSTIFAMVMVIMQGLGAMAMAVLIAMVLREAGHFEHELEEPERMRDLGNLMLIFTMVWGYTAFSQYLIQWSGDLPQEVEFYSFRSEGGWQWLSMALFVLEFAAPFLFVLMRRVKQQTRGLKLIAGLLLVGLVLNMFWTVKPMFSPSVLRLHWLDVAIVPAIGGFWVALFVSGLKRNLAEAARERLHG